MDAQQIGNLRQRLKALLAIPDSERTEAQWDEIIELEIALAPGNREDIPADSRRKSKRASAQAKSPSAGRSKKPFKKFHKRPPKAPPT